jgi:hypothetical protein
MDSSTLVCKYLKQSKLTQTIGGAKLQSFMRLKLSLSLRQWSREYTILKFKTKKRKKEFLFQKFFFF